MSSSIIDSADAVTTPSTGTRATHHSMPRAWLVAVAVVAVTTLGLTVAWRATPDAAATNAPVAGAPDAAAPGIPAVSAGAGLLAVAWELTPPSQRDSVCAQFAADPVTSWASYSDGADAASIATRLEFAAFLDVSC